MRNWIYAHEIVIIIIVCVAFILTWFLLGCANVKTYRLNPGDEITVSATTEILVYVEGNGYKLKAKERKK